MASNFSLLALVSADNRNEFNVYFNPQVETCQEKIISLELEDPKSLESPTTPTTEDFIHAHVQHRLQFSSDDSDDNQSMVTVRGNYMEDTLVLTPTDPDDFVNANVFVKFTPGIIEGRPPSNLQTIVEVVNPMLVGDGTATEIAIGRANDDASLPSFDVEMGDDDEHDGVVVLRRELSLNDKMKNVLKELKENKKVRLSLSRSMEDGDEMDDDDDDDVEPAGSENDASASYEEKTGSIGTVFMVRERLINDFYDHPDSTVPAEGESAVAVDDSQATVFANPSVDEFLANEIRHAQTTFDGDSLKSRKETLTLDLNVATDEVENDDGDDNDDTTTPTTPTKSSTDANGEKKKKRKKNKNKKK